MGLQITAQSVSKTLIDIRTSKRSGTWTIQEWSSGKKLPKVVVKRSGNSPLQQLPGFLPASSARDIIRSQYGLTEVEVWRVGHGATALVSYSSRKEDSRLTSTLPGFFR